MDETAYAQYLMTALNKRLTDGGFEKTCAGGWGLADLPPRAPRPNMLIAPISEGDYKYTNKHKYLTVRFALDIATDTFQDGQNILQAAYKTIQNAPLAFPDSPGLKLLKLRPAGVEYEKTGDEWGTVAQYDADLAQAINHSPS